MSKPFHMTVLTPDAKIFDGEAVSALVPGADGYIGILAHHAPLIASLIPGTLQITEPGGFAPRKFAVKSGGFVEVSRNAVTLLAEIIEPAVSSV